MKFRKYPKIKELRKAAGMTGEELAAKTYVTQGMISGIENGCRQASIPLLERIAKVFDVTVNDLL